MRSACRGVARNAPAPNRSRSKRDAPTAIISIAQHASPNVIGHSEFFRAQLIAKSRLVTIRPSSKRFSIQDMSSAPFCERDQEDYCTATGSAQALGGLQRALSITRLRARLEAPEPPTTLRVTYRSAGGLGVWAGDVTFHCRIAGGRSVQGESRAA